MNKNKTNVQFCFPENNPNDADKLVESIVAEITKDDSGVGELAHQNYLRNRLYGKFESGSTEKYQSLDDNTVTKIKENTEEVIHKCRSKLPLPSEPLNIFIMPWFPGESDEVFRGTMGYTPWERTFQLLLDPAGFSVESMRETVAHEYNHAVYFCHHLSAKNTILNSMIMEGLAEKFRETVVGGDRAPWSTALSKEEVKESIDKLKEDFDTIDHNLYNDVFFGSDKYKRWTGYSIGYRVVDELLQDTNKAEWGKLMKANSQSILQGSPYSI
jgi:uncharacterized protein YjaZ